MAIGMTQPAQGQPRIAALIPQLTGASSPFLLTTMKSEAVVTALFATIALTFLAGPLVGLGVGAFFWFILSGDDSHSVRPQAHIPHQPPASFWNRAFSYMPSFSDWGSYFPSTNYASHSTVYGPDGAHVGVGGGQGRRGGAAYEPPRTGSGRGGHFNVNGPDGEHRGVGGGQNRGAAARGAAHGVVHGPDGDHAAVGGGQNRGAGTGTGSTYVQGPDGAHTAVGARRGR